MEIEARYSDPKSKGMHTSGNRKNEFDLVKIRNDTKRYQLKPWWNSPSDIIDYFDNNSLIIKNKEKIIRVHIVQALPYFADEAKPSTSNYHDVNDD